MSTPPQICQPTRDLAAVAHVVWNHDCGFIPVVDADGRLAGLITDRGICIASATRRLRPERIAAAEAMGRSVHAGLPGDDVETVLAAMKTHMVRTDPGRRCQRARAGVVSMNDVVRVVGKKGAPSSTAATVATLAAICTPRAVETAVVSA